VGNAGFQAHARAERKAAQTNLLFGILLSQIIEPGTHVVLLSVAFIVRPGALSDAAKIDAQRNQSHIIQSRGSAKDDFVMHCAAAEWMRMQHQSYAANFAVARLFQNRLEPSMRRGNEKIACRIHSSRL
jgi:hypothetical protein